jgi:hypothetical protein
MCLNETCGKFRIEKYLWHISYSGGVWKNESSTNDFHFYFRMGVFKAHQNYVKLDGKHQVLIYADNVNLLDVISQLLFLKKNTGSWTENRNQRHDKINAVTYPQFKIKSFSFLICLFLEELKHRMIIQNYLQHLSHDFLYTFQQWKFSVLNCNAY